MLTPSTYATVLFLLIFGSLLPFVIKRGWVLMLIVMVILSVAGYLFLI